MRNGFVLKVVLAFMFLCLPAMTQEWRTAWATASQGPYPVGFPQGQPDLSRVFPDPQQGAEDQTFRMLVRPDIWGEQTRIRFTNVFGTRPVTIDGAHVGLHQGGATVVGGTNVPVLFNGGEQITIQPGESAWSDAVSLPFVQTQGKEYLYGRRLAVSFHVVGASGPMTWHALGNNTSYISWPKAGSRGAETGEEAFPFSTISWFLIDAVDMSAPEAATTIVCFGDSITDGHMSSINGDDSWPDAFGRLVKTQRGDAVSVVNTGIAGNMILTPEKYGPESNWGGGPAALERLDRDILDLSGVGAVIWLEGINDIHTAGKSAGEIADGMRRAVTYIREKNPGIRVIGATLTSSLEATHKKYGTPEVDQQRRALNDFIRSTDIFDAVVDFDAAILDESTGKMRPEYAPSSSFGGPGDFLHPNRAGYLKMAEAIELDAILPKAR